MPTEHDSGCLEYKYVTYDDYNPGEGHIQHNAHCCHHPQGDGYCDCANCPKSKEHERET